MKIIFGILGFLFLLEKEPVCCKGRENITHTLNPTTITQDHNRSTPLFLRGIIFVLPLILLLTLTGDGLDVHTKQQQKCLNMVNPKASLSPSLSSLSLSLSLTFSHSCDEKSVVFPCDIFQRYACVVIDFFPIWL